MVRVEFPNHARRAPARINDAAADTFSALALGADDAESEALEVGADDDASTAAVGRCERLLSDSTARE